MIDRNREPQPPSRNSAGRRAAAAGFGLAVTLPLAAPAAAMLPADGGGAPVSAPPNPPKPSPSKPATPTPAPRPQAKPAPAREPAPPPVSPAPSPRPANPTIAADPKPDPKPEPRPAVTPKAAPEPVAQKPAPAPPPVTRPQVYGMDSFTYHHLPPDDQQAIRKEHEPKPANPTTAPEPSRFSEPQPAAKGQPKPANPTIDTGVKPAPPKPEPATPAPSRPQQYGMDSFTYHHLPPDDQQSIRSGFNKEHGLNAQGCAEMIGPIAAGQGRPCTYPDGRRVALPPVGTQPTTFTPQSGTTGIAVGPGRRTIDAMPFPGSVSVSCSQATELQMESKGGPCGMPMPGQKKLPEPEAKAPKGPTFSIDVGATTTNSRSDSTLDEDGRQRTTLDVTSELKVTGKAGIDGKVVGADGSVYGGASKTYQVTVDSSRVDELGSGRATMPNPYDPRSLRNGEGIQLSQKDFTGTEGSVSYRALQLGLDYEKSHKVSAGVQRVDDGTARIFVGDENSVKNALTLGLGTGDVGLAVSMSNEFGEGKIKSVDLDITTPQGWAAYQRFVNGGEVPAVTRPDQPGIEDASQSDTATWAGGASIEAKAGPIKISVGGTSVEGNVTEAHHPDGTVDNSLTARDGDVTMRELQTLKPDGTDGDSSYSLSLKGVDKHELENLTYVNTHNKTAYSHDGDASMSFSEDDLRQIQRDALDFMSWGTKQARQEMAPEEIKKTLQDDPYAVVPMLGGADPVLSMIGSAKYPREVLAALYTAARGNPNEVAELLIKTHLNAGVAHGENNFKKLSPGTLTTY